MRPVEVKFRLIFSDEQSCHISYFIIFPGSYIALKHDHIHRLVHFQIKDMSDHCNSEISEFMLLDLSKITTIKYVVLQIHLPCRVSQQTFNVYSTEKDPSSFGKWIFQ